MDRTVVKRTAQLFLIGLAGAALASLLGIPGALLIGPMVAVAGSRLAGLELSKDAPGFGQVGKVVLGTFIGASFNRRVLAQLGGLLPAAVATMLAVIATALALAWVLSKLTHMNLATALFSLTPGGMPEMIAMAEEVGADVAVVAALQFLRMSSVIVLAPAIVHWFFS